MVDVLVRGDVLTMDAAGTVIADGAVAVVGSMVAAVGPFAELRRLHPDAEVIGSASSIVTPGYVNAHQHLTGDRLVRSSIPDHIDSQESIFGWAVPIHSAHTADDDELSATLSLVEAIGNGITTTVEAGTVAHPERVVAAYRSVGARGTIGRWGWDVDGVPFGGTASEVLERAEALLDAVVGDPLVQPWVTLVGHDLFSDELVIGASALAAKRDTGLTFHISPHGGDAASFLASGRQRPLVHLDSLGVLGRHVLLAHAVHLDDAEVDVVLRTGSAIAACPWAYLRLAQGVTVAGRYRELYARGGRFALGCDAENASDAIDVLRQASLFVGLARDASMDPTSLTAADGLRLATIAGAEAIGMGDRIGSLEVGKQADIVVHSTAGAQWHPRGLDSVLQLIWASDGRSVNDVLIAGKVVVSEGRCTTVDVESLWDEATTRRNSLLRAAGKL